MKLIKTILNKIADFQATVFLSLCFFLLVPIFAFIVKSRTREEKSTWSSWDITSDTLLDVKKQY